MLPSRPAPAGPFTRSIREALEAAVSVTAAQNILGEALKRAGLTSVPEEIEPFRRFCEGPFRTVVRATMGEESIEQVFERLGHVLWMATSDVQALEAARAWSRGTGQSFARDVRDGESGVRHVEPLPGSPPRSPSRPGAARPEDPPSAPALRRPTVPAPPSPSPPTPRTSTSVVGRMRPTASGLVAPRGATTEVGPGALHDPRRASAPPAGPARPSPVPPRSAPNVRFTPLPPSPTPVRVSSSPPPPASPAGAQRLPSAVLVVTLDPSLVADVEELLAGDCLVRAIGTPSDLAAVIPLVGARAVVVVDTALPSIDVPTFAELAPVLPDGTRVVLWGASSRQQQRLAAMFPVASRWIASGPASSAGRFLLELR